MSSFNLIVDDTGNHLLDRHFVDFFLPGPARQGVFAGPTTGR